MKTTLLFLFLVLMASSCNNTYDVGAASYSIEPTNETVSLTLAGYANPPEGRFTLTWDDLGMCDYLSLFQIQDSVLLLNNQYELSIAEKDNFSTAKRLIMNSPVKDIVFFNHKFYGINLEGELVTGDLNQKTISWTKILPVIKSVALTASKDYIFIVDRENRLLKGSSFENAFELIPDHEIFNIASITCDSNRLYALTGENVLFQKSLIKNEPWLKIGYKNNITYKIDAVNISFINGNLYAIDNKNHLYKSKHCTTGELKATAMSITKNGKTVIIVGVDVCGFDKTFTDNIKEAIYQKRGIAKESILINASHTHFAPVTQSWITWQPPNQKPDSLYLLNVVQTGIIKAIEQSLNNRQPSHLYFQRGTCNIGKNRRNITDYNIYDNTVDVITAVSVKNKKKILLFLAGCHPVVTDPEVDYFTINANFPGHAEMLLKKESDIENVLFLQAFAGDINPTETFKKSGKQLADSVRQIVNRKTADKIKGNISFYMDTIAIPVTPLTQYEIENFKNSKKTGDMLAERNARWADLMLDLYKKNLMSEKMSVYYQTFNIGDWKLVALSREVTTEFGIAIRDIWPDKKVSAVAYSNDVSSYLSTDPHIRAKNYEGYDSFFWYGQPSPFPLKTFNRIIHLIKETNH
jgi:uncharacterized protein YxjI